MKTVSGTMATHIDSGGTTMATCWRVKRVDNTVLGFTDHDQDIVFNDGDGSVTYKAKGGFTRGEIPDEIGFDAPGVTLEGVLESAAITETDVRAGKYDFAEVKVFEVNYADLTMGSLPLRKGLLGECSLQGLLYVAELRPLAALLETEILETYSPTCRASVFDSRCALNPASFTQTGTVTTVTNKRIFRASAWPSPPTSDHWNLGVVTWTSGANNGLKAEIRSYVHTPNQEFTLYLAMPFTISAGDTFSATPGCDKKLNTCKVKYNNVPNFRGEPHVPSPDQVQRLPPVSGSTSGYRTGGN